MALTGDGGVGGGSGGGTGVSVGNGAAQILCSGTLNKDVMATKVVVRAASTGSFRLNLFFGDGTNWYIAKQVASSTVTVDGGTASYVASAVIDEFCPYFYKVELWNSSGSTQTIAWDQKVVSF